MAPIYHLLLLALLPAALATPALKQVAFDPASDDKPWLGADYGSDTALHAHTPFTEDPRRFDGHEVWRIDYSKLSSEQRDEMLSYIEENVSY